MTRISSVSIVRGWARTSKITTTLIERNQKHVANVSNVNQLTVLLQGHKADTFADCWDTDSVLVDTARARRAAVLAHRMVEIGIGLDKDLK